jgi:hypothetical protein
MADSSTATGIVLIAGTATFANEWYQTGKVNFKVGVATLLAAAAFDAFAKVSSKGANALAVMVLIAAITTRFDGKSVADTLAEMFAKTSKKTSGKTQFSPATTPKERAVS